MDRRLWTGIGLALGLAFGTWWMTPSGARAPAAGPARTSDAPQELLGASLRATQDSAVTTRSQSNTEPQQAAPRMAEPKDDLDTAAPEGTKPWVSGRVVDEHDQPIEGADLFVSDPWGEQQLLGHSQADGTFRVHLSGPALAYTILASGFEGAYGSLNASVAEELRLGVIRMKPGGELLGRVLDDHGTPIRGAWIHWHPPEVFPEDPIRAREAGIADPEGNLWRSGGWNRFEAFARSSADGAFHLRGLPLGDGFAAATAAGHGYGWTRLLEVGRAPLLAAEIELVPSGSAASAITGQILARNGEPVPRGQIQVLREDTWSWWEQADASGNFYLESDGALTLRAADGRGKKSAAVNALPGTRDLVLRFEEPVWLTVKLQDAEERAIPWGHITVLDQGGGPIFDTGRAGEVRVPLPEEPFRLQGSAPGYRSENFGPFDPATTELVLTLRPGQVLRGVVRHAGRRVGGARVDLCRTAPPNSVREGSGIAPKDHPFLLHGNVQLSGHDGTTDSNGAFLLTVYDDDWHSLRVDADGFPVSVFGPHALVKDGENAPLAIELERAGAIEGHVRAAPGSRSERLVAASSGWSFAHTAPVESDGSYRLEGLQPGRYQLRVCRPPLASLQAYEARGETTEGFEWDCAVRPGATSRVDLETPDEEAVILRGQLTRASAPTEAWVARLVLAKTDLFQRREPRAQAELGPDGRFELRLSRPGPYVLEFRGPNGRVLSCPIALQLGANEWRHTLRTIPVRILGRADAEDSRLFLRLLGGDGALEFSASGICPRSGDEQGWCFDLPVGPARLETKRNYFDANEPWQLLRSVDVPREGELVIESP